MSPIGGPSTHRRSSQRPRVVVGVADHGGWAVLMTAALENRTPTVVDRRRVEIIEPGVPTQPYHHDTLTLDEAAAERLVRKVKRSVALSTARALDRLAHDLGSAHRIAGLAMREPTLERLPASVKDAHASYHVMCRADGMLYHSALVEAAERRGWPVTFVRRGDELARAAEALQTTERTMEGRVRDLGRTLGPPWTADHRYALAAAVATLRA